MQFAQAVLMLTASLLSCPTAFVFPQVIEGMGELHLDIIVDRLKREFNVDCKVGAPQVSRRKITLTTRKSFCMP